MSRLEEDIGFAVRMWAWGRVVALISCIMLAGLTLAMYFGFARFVKGVMLGW